jgi:hypothetical protein
VRWGFQPEAFEIDAPDVLINEPRELLKLVLYLHTEPGTE